MRTTASAAESEQAGLNPADVEVAKEQPGTPVARSDDRVSPTGGSGAAVQDTVAAANGQPDSGAGHVGDPGGTGETTDANEAIVADGGDASAREPLLDRTRDSVYGVVRGTAQTIDNIFGSNAVDDEATVSRGRVSVGGQWDERDGFRERLRLKARFALPAMNDRASLLIGRGDADEVVDGSGDENVDRLPVRFNDFEDDDWLVGIGYSRDGSLRRGWDFGVGVKVTTPLEPYVRATYHRNKTLGERWLWRLRPRAFWQNQRGAGVSLQNTFDYAANERWLYRWWTIVVAEEEVDGLAWNSKLTAYQNLSDKSAIAYAVYASGETGFEVREKDYGVELRYRRQISRDWLFIELLTFVSWPRELAIERREANPGVGIEFEMQFGDWPGRPHE